MSNTTRGDRRSRSRYHPLVSSDWPIFCSGNPVIVARTAPDAIDAIEKLPTLARQHGRLVGFFSYDLGRLFEHLPDKPFDDLDLPLLAFGPASTAPASSTAPPSDSGRQHDRPTGPASTTGLTSTTGLASTTGLTSTNGLASTTGLASTSGLASTTGPASTNGLASTTADATAPVHQGVPRSNFALPDYLAAVQRCLDYIAAGDIFQVNLAQRLSMKTARSPRDVFLHLRRRYPAPHDALLDFGTFQIVSNSPELFFRVERIDDRRRRIVNRPIKGTRPRRPGMRRELEASVKDRAELAMIVDLQRNDLGRICDVGSVRVIEPRVIEEHPTVYHGVATVEGVLGNHVRLADILRAVFPCGSITGCPKIRAMQIIDELEPHARGAYCGAIGFIDPDGTMEFSVAIRTIVFRNDWAHLGVGGGIVADSRPEAEFDETLVKSRALLDALGARLPDHLTET